jgi:sugar phosphate isomerase/epimerase
MLYGAMNSPLRPVLDQVESIRNLGFDYLELTLDSPEAHYSLVARSRKELSKRLKRLGMGLVVHLPTFVSTADLTESLRKASVKETLRSLELGAGLGALKAVLHPSFHGGLSVFVMERARVFALESLERIVGRAGDLGIPLCLENLFPNAHSLMEPEHFTDVLKRFPDLQMTLDIGHANIQDPSGGRAVRFIERFGDRIGHIHASDNSGKGDDHLPIGAGTVKWPNVLDALALAGYDGTVTFEIFTPDPDYLRISREKFAGMFRAGNR